MDDGHLRLVDAERRVSRHVAIDLFFRTLAHAHGERAFAGNHVGHRRGRRGRHHARQRAWRSHAGPVAGRCRVRRHAARGGSRPATSTSCCRSPSWPQRLIELAESAARIRLPEAEEGMPSRQPPDRSDESERALKEIKALVRKRTGHDFTYYKRATVLRRIERRLQVTGRQDLASYCDHLLEEPAEIDGLLQDLLISVTNFFRDRDAFEALERESDPAALRRTRRESSHPRMGGRLCHRRGGLFDRDAVARLGRCAALERRLPGLRERHRRAGPGRRPQRLLSAVDRGRRERGTTAQVFRSRRQSLPHQQGVARAGAVRAS